MEGGNIDSRVRTILTAQLYNNTPNDIDHNVNGEQY